MIITSKINKKEMTQLKSKQQSQLFLNNWPDYFD